MMHGDDDCDDDGYDTHKLSAAISQRFGLLVMITMETLNPKPPNPKPLHP